MEDTDNFPRTTPKRREAADCIPEWIAYPSKADFRYVRLNRELADLQSANADKNKELVEQINELSGGRLSQDEAKVYEILVKMERALTWDGLMRLRSQLFLLESEEGKMSSAPPEQEERSPMKFMPGVGINEASFLAVKGLQNRSPGDSDEEEKALPSFLKTEDQPEEVRRLSESMNASALFDFQKQRDKLLPPEAPKKAILGVPELSPEVREEFALAETVVGARRRRLCGAKLDDLFQALFEDLRQFCELLEEGEDPDSIEQEPLSPEEDDRVSGPLWLARGQLAERLCLLRAAEKAYRRCLEKGFSLLATNRLMRLYSIVGNIKSVLLLVDQALDSMERLGHGKVDFLPLWMQEHVLTLVHLKGLRAVKKVARELQLEDPTIQRFFKDVPTWLVDGADR
eukprot:TRINITY_DN24599_c0_g1_i1.p1 TRINITY_DN24599_c0_g1~~TRINITY_DN24599_c0_g1_i1.p1  ORF type:complete len:401 (-),score=114.87 TRINITY_DN24599_c0_g1_i1:10-1212(-)